MGDKTQLDKYQNAVEGLEKLKQKLKEQEERETQEKEEKARLEIKRKFRAKTVEKESYAC